MSNNDDAKETSPLESFFFRQHIYEEKCRSDNGKNSNLRQVIDKIVDQNLFRSSKRDDDEFKQTVANFKYIRFIIICAQKLEANDITLSTACMIFHRLSTDSSQIKDFDLYLIATSCIYLASKIEEECLKLRDIINVCYRTLHPKLSPLELDDKYWSLRNSVIQTELFAVRILAFNMDFDHPHKYVLQYLDSLRHWLQLDVHHSCPLIANSWQILRDLLHSDLYLQYKPQDVAVSVIYFVCMCHGIQVPYNDKGEVSWWKALNEKANKDLMYEIMEQIVRVYELDKAVSSSFST